MQVVLLKDMPRVGKKWEVKEVRGGYARNFLIPNGFAAVARASEVRYITARRDAAVAAAEALQSALENALSALEGKTLNITRKVGEKGRLFSGIGRADVAEAIRNQIGMDVPEEIVQLPAAIKQAGTHPVQIISAQGGAIHTITVVVEPEK